METVAEAARPVEQTVEQAAARTSEAVGTAQEVAARETLPAEVAVERGRGALYVAVGAFIGFLGIFALVRAKRTASFDLAVTMKLQAFRWRWLSGLMQLASWPGFPPQSRIIPPVIIAALWVLRLRLEATFQLLGWMTALISSLLKEIMKRPRPDRPDLRIAAGRLWGSSFPSGHTITYVGVYGFLAYLAHTLLRPVRARRAIVGSLLGLVGLVGPSRIYSGHHWLTDVSASYLLGVSYLIGLTSLYRRVKARLKGV